MDVHSRTAGIGKRRTAASGVTTFEPSRERASAYGLATSECGLGSAVTGRNAGIGSNAGASRHDIAAGCHSVAEPVLSRSGNGKRSGANALGAAPANDDGSGGRPLHRARTRADEGAL